MKILTTTGVYQQFIKVPVVSRTFVAQGISKSIVHTYQYFNANMSDVFVDELEIKPPVNLDHIVEAIASALEIQSANVQPYDVSNGTSVIVKRLSSGAML